MWTFMLVVRGRGEAAEPWCCQGQRSGRWMGDAAGVAGDAGDTYGVGNPKGVHTHVASAYHIRSMKIHI